MKVLHVIATLDPADGGPPAVVRRLSAALAGQGIETGILCFPHASPAAAAAEPIPGFERVTVHLLPPPPIANPVITRPAMLAMKRIIRAHDLVHLHGVWDPIIKAAAGEARSARKPYVIAAHGMLDPWSLAQKRWKKRIALWFGYKAMLNRAVFLHALNSDEAQLMRPLSLRPPVEVLPNGVFLEEIDPPPAPGSFHRRHPELEGNPYILFLGRLHAKKGLDILSQAFEVLALKDTRVRLVVAGPDAGALAPFQRKVKHWALAPRVHVVGALYGRDKYEAYVDAACFCLPSRQEGFSVAALEAMACATPVVISESCHFREAAQAGAGQVTTLDPTAIAAALRQVMGDEAKRVQMGRAGRALVERHYTWPVIAQRCAAAYERALGSGEGRP